MQQPRLFIWTEDPPIKVRQALGNSIKHDGVAVDIGNQLPVFGQPQPTAILCLGNAGKAGLQAQGAIPKGRTITSLRGQIHKAPTSPTPIMFSYSAGIGEIDYGKFVDLTCDVQAALRVAKTGNIKPTTGSYKYVPDLSHVVFRVEQLASESKALIEAALDLETLGLDPYHPDAYIVSIQVSVEKGKSSVVKFHSKSEMQAWFSHPTNRNILHHLLNYHRISMRGANLKYDLNWIYEHTKFTGEPIACTNFKFDTTLVGSLLDENRSNGLDVHTKVYVPELAGYSDNFDKTVDKSRMDLALVADPDAFLNYAGGDTDACLRVAEVQKSLLLQDNALTGFYVTILHPAARAFEIVERGGVLVDMDAYKQLDADLIAEIHSLIQKAKPIIGGRLVARHQDLEKLGGINLTKASLLIDFMFSPAGLNLKPLMFTEGSEGKDEKTPSTAMEHLLMFKDVPAAKDFVGLLANYAQATKTRNTYVTGFLKHLRSDGRFHPSYWFFAGNKDEGDGGTSTGRLSAHTPAFQTIPKHTKWAKRIRKCFIAPPGYVIIENDYSQGELRVIACVANEPTMLAAYAAGADLHALTGGRIGGYSYEQMMGFKDSDDPKLVEIYEDLRQLAKAGNFGLIYGMGATGFQAYALANYGVELTMEQAETFRNTFFDTYAALPVYHDQYKKLARLHGYVRSPLGRIRHLPLINSPNHQYRAQEQRRAINSPIQSTLSDMMIWAIALSHKRGWFEESPCFGAVHDAKYVYALEDNYLFYAKREKELMESLPFEQVGWKPQLSFPVDAKFGKNMADLEKVKFNA